MRPIRFCAKCGEYVTEKWVSSSGDRSEKRLVHINAEGTTIYRSHAAIEEITNAKSRPRRRRRL